MPKFNRWRGGLKSGNRREKDMTQGTFNQEFNLSSSRSIRADSIDRDLNWKFQLQEDQGNNDGKMRVERVEGTDEETFTDKAIFGDAYSSDTYLIGLEYGAYKVPGSTQEHVTAVRRLNAGTNGVALGNYKGTTALITDNENDLFHITKGEPFSLVRTGDDGLTEDDYLDFDYREFSMFEGRLGRPLDHAVLLSNISMWCATSGISYQVTFSYEDTGQVLYVSDSDYDFFHSLGALTNTGLTTVVFPDGLAIEEERQVIGNVKFLAPTLVGGGLIDDITPPGALSYPIPIEPEVPEETYVIFFKTEGNVLDVTNVATTRDHSCYEFAARHDATPHSMHSEDGSIILNEDCEYIEWFNPLGTLSTKDRLCNYEWAVSEIASPGAIHAEDYCIILNEDNEYIEWIP